MTAASDPRSPFEDEALMDWAAAWLRRGLRRRQAAEAQADTGREEEVEHDASTP